MSSRHAHRHQPHGRVHLVARLYGWCSSLAAVANVAESTGWVSVEFLHRARKAIGPYGTADKARTPANSTKPGNVIDGQAMPLYPPLL